MCSRMARIVIITLAWLGGVAMETSASAGRPAASDSVQVYTWANPQDHCVLVSVPDENDAKYWGNPRETLNLKLRREFTHTLCITWFTPDNPGIVQDWSEDERRKMEAVREIERKRGVIRGTIHKTDMSEVAWDVRQFAWTTKSAATPASSQVAAVRQPAVVVIPFTGGTDRLSRGLGAAVDPGRYVVQPLSNDLLHLPDEGNPLDRLGKAARLALLEGGDIVVAGNVDQVTGVITAVSMDARTAQITHRGSVWLADGDLDTTMQRLAAQLELRAAVTSPATQAATANSAGHEVLDPVNPNRAFGVTLATSTGRLGFFEGERLKLAVQGDHDCYLTLITRDCEGKLTLLLPNRWQPQASLRQGERLVIPPDNAEYEFPIQAPHRQTIVKVIATAQPLVLEGVNDNEIREQQLVSLNSDVRAIGLQQKQRTAPVTRPATDGQTGLGASSHRTLRELFEHPGDWSTAELVIATRAAPAPRQ